MNIDFYETESNDMRIVKFVLVYDRDISMKDSLDEIVSRKEEMKVKREFVSDLNEIERLEKRLKELRK